MGEEGEINEYSNEMGFACKKCQKVIMICVFGFWRLFSWLGELYKTLLVGYQTLFDPNLKKCENMNDLANLRIKSPKPHSHLTDDFGQLKRS